MKAKYFIAMLIALMLILNGCASKSEYEQKVGELDAAKKEISRLKEQLKEKESKASILIKNKSELENKVREEYQNALAKLRSQKDSIQKQLLGKSNSLSQLQGLLSQKDLRITSKDAALKEKDDKINALMEQINALTSGSSPGLEGAKGLFKR